MLLLLGLWLLMLLLMMLFRMLRHMLMKFLNSRNRPTTTTDFAREPAARVHGHILSITRRMLEAVARIHSVTRVFFSRVAQGGRIGGIAVIADCPASLVIDRIARVVVSTGRIVVARRGRTTPLWVLGDSGENIDLVDQSAT
jgi:hypothetical protein